MDTILVIDDDPSLRDTLSVILEREGFQTVLASDGRTGFQQALELRSKLARDHPKSPQYQGALADAHSSLAGGLAGMGKREEAVKEHRLAIALRRDPADLLEQIHAIVQAQNRRARETEHPIGA